jgi:hypothetical protein
MSLMIDHQTLGAEALEQTPRSSPESAPRPPAPPPSRPLFSFVKLSTVTVVVFFLTLVIAEHAAPSQWRPSTVIGAFGGKEKTAEMLASLDADRALVAMQEQEKARAMQEIELFRANQDRLTRAYQAEYDRGTELIRAGAMAAQEILRASTMAKIEALRGKAENSNLADRIGAACSFLEMLSGNSVCSQEAHSYAAVQRGDMQAEIIGAWKRSQGEIIQIARSWADGLPDPLHLIQQAQSQAPASFTVPPRAPTPLRPDRPQPQPS